MQKDNIYTTFINFVSDIVFTVMGVITLSGFSSSNTLFGSNTIVTKTTILLLGLWLICFIILTNMLCWHYDKYLKDKILNNPLSQSLVINLGRLFDDKPLIHFKLYRALNFYIPAVTNIKRYRKNKNIKAVFEDFDFNQHTTPLEKWLGEAFWWITFFLLLFLFFYTCPSILS